MNVLIVDDEKRISEGVRKYFEQAGFSVQTAYDGNTALKIALSGKPDLIVLDWMLPGMSGIGVCREIRRESNVPIIMLTARVEESDKLIGLELGADDYITKPFSPRELVARARTVLRRAQMPPVQTRSLYEFGSVVVDTNSRECRVNNELISLTPTEFDLLVYLIRHPNQVFSRSQLLDAIDLGSFEGVERTVDVHIHNLRKKIEQDPANPQFISTVFGVGYKFNQLSSKS
jgi:two-component system alkaline phosphatase synthesis response regulator PhoP